MKPIAPNVAALLPGLAMNGPLPAVVEEAPGEHQITEQVVGEGPEVHRGWFAIVHFTGRVCDGQAATRIVTKTTINRSKQ